MDIFYYQKGDYDQSYGNQFPLYINNFGYYKGINKKVTTSRPLGRQDYQLIYVSNGELVLPDKKLYAGDFCVFLPNTPQSYSYIPSESCSYYWIHFIGYDVPSILKENGIINGFNQGNGRKLEADNLFRAFKDSLLNSEKTITPYSISLLNSILLLLSSKTLTTNPYLKAVRLIEDLTKQVTIKELASLYNMSQEHFIRSFKNAYGKTPQNYRICYQISQAKNLLADTQLHANQVAEICGFSDYYYFSRLFKKYEGISPTEYKKNSTQSNR